MTSAPEQFENRTLVAVSGLSPQIVTETLFALAVTRQPAFVPTEVRLITTAEGAERAMLSLQSANPGWFHRLRAEYDLPPIRFDESCFHVLQDSAGQRLGDIRTEEDNRVAADQITALLREFTSKEDTALHVSIAGGRKTMGFYLGYSLSLFGRPQDRLSHVLVSAPFESHPGFFYPARERTIIYTAPPDSRPLDSSRAEVTLAEIPFVRLRDWLPENVLRGQAVYQEAIRAAQRQLEPPRLEFRLKERTVICGETPLHLPPAELAFFSWLARRKAEGREPVACPSDGAPETRYAEEFLREYRLVIGKLGNSDRTEKALRHGMEKSFFLERKARLVALLRSALSMDAARLAPRAMGRRPGTRFPLPVEAKNLSWLD